jgi:hypothetical protein
MELGKNALLALQTINGEKTEGIPTWFINLMQHDQLEYFAGVEDGEYEANPEEVYLKYQRSIGTCLLDQYIPLNPLVMGSRGFDSNTNRAATTGITEIRVNDILIDSPEAVVEHMEKYQNPLLEEQSDHYDIAANAEIIIKNENAIQKKLGCDILKSGFGYTSFPILPYELYGYENYFMAYALYPEVIERNFKLQADLAAKINKAASIAIINGDLPSLIRLDHDMADSRGMLVDIKSLDKIWFPQLERALKPLIDNKINLIWHCDGNLSQMVPRLLNIGLSGFQGFQYEDNMDYVEICKMKTREGKAPFIIAGLSVTRTLPFGTPVDVKKELKFLVENGPETGLVLGCSSSIAPGIPHQNLITMNEGFAYYREHGRSYH